jgi:hypothetical protein
MLKLTDISGVHTASNTRAVSEMLVNFNMTTRRYIPVDSKPHTRHRESLKSHKIRDTVILFLSLFCLHLFISVID